MAAVTWEWLLQHMAFHWPHHPSDPVPLPSALFSVLGQRCRDLLLQLYLQRPEVRVPVPEVLLHSEGATSSSICKVRDTAPTERGVGGRGGCANSLNSPHITSPELRLLPWVQPSAEGCPSPFCAQVVGRQESAHVLHVACGQYRAMASIRRCPVTPE